MLTSGTQPWAGPAPRSTGHPLQLVPGGPCSLLQAGCAAEASPGDAAVAWPWERCPCPSQHAGVRPDCTWAGSSFQALLWPEQCQAQMPEAPGRAPGPLPMCWGHGRGGSWEAGADVVEQSSQHPVGGWGKLGVEAVVGCTTLLLPHPAVASSLMLYGDVQQAVQSLPSGPLPGPAAGTVPWWPLMWPFPPLHGPGTC